MRTYTLTLLGLLFSCFALAQSTISIRGIVTDSKDSPLPGVDIFVKGANFGTVSQADGTFQIEASEGATLVFSFLGFSKKEVRVASGQGFLSVSLVELNTNLAEVTVIGSRNKSRTALTSAVPVDIIDIKELSVDLPQVNANQLLNYIAPSFSSQPQVVADGTDHIDPASLRGLGPDQVLVLINGKRRHTTALVNVNGTPGRGSVGTDLNAIPLASIERVEVLRDGAAAQYGSDAIAGIINIVLKKDVDDLAVSFHTGANFSANGNNFQGGVDGEEIQFNINRGMSIGDNGGYINLTGSLNARNRTSRSRPFTGEIFNGYNAIEWVAAQNGGDLATLQTDLGAIRQYGSLVSHFTPSQRSAMANANSLDEVRDLLSDADGDPIDFSDAELAARGLDRSDFQMNIGQPELRGGSVFMNMSIPLKNAALYAFGGISHRKSVGFAYYRRPTQSRTYTPLNINGHRPEGLGDVDDQSLSVGLKQNIGKWQTDLSNTWGTNIYKFVTGQSTNASLQSASPKTFDSWNMRFTQNTTNFDMVRAWDGFLEGFNLAMGAEYRLENYQVIAAEDRAWALYDINGNVVNDINLLADSLKVVDFFGRLRPGGAQAFPGFQPENSVDAFRQSFAAYADAELDLTDRWVLQGAVRFENYSDFGSTINYKVATRYSINESLAFRASSSSGFRAPSLHQINFSSISTQFINGIGAQVLTASNTSTLARELGIPELKQETSQDFSVGFTGKIDAWGLTFSVDAYTTRINDRVILTDMFTQDEFVANGRQDLVTILASAGAEKVQFFANAINTQTNGIEMVITQTSSLGKNLSLRNSLAASALQTRQVGAIQSSEQLKGFEEVYFGERSRILLEESMPRTKVNLMHDFQYRKWHFLLANTYFGAVTEADPYEVDNQDVYDVYRARVITNLSVGYQITPKLHCTVGADNLFDLYPDERNGALTDGDQFIYPRRIAQFGTNGRYLFARINLSL